MKRPTLILETAIVLLLCAAGAALSHLWKSGPLTMQTALVALIVPSIATGLYLCLSVSVSELYAVGKLKPPITITLPLVYGIALFLTMTLMSRVGLSIARMPEQLLAVTVWGNPWVLGSAVIAGVICLSILSALESERDDRDTPPSA